MTVYYHNKKCQYSNIVFLFSTRINIKMIVSVQCSCLFICLHHVVMQSHTSIPIYVGHFLYHDNSMFCCVPFPYSFLGHGKLTQFGGSENLISGDIHWLATERIRTFPSCSIRWVHLRHTVTFLGLYCYY